MKRIEYTLLGVVLLSAMGVSSLIPTLPLLAETFLVSAADSALVISVFAVPGLFFTPFIGILSDRFGRKTILVPSLLLYAFSGVFCAFAPSFFWLLVCRFAQGIGGSSFSLLYSTIIADTWDDMARAQKMSFAAILLGIASALFPGIGGILASFDWRLPFMLPLAAVPVALLAWQAPLIHHKEVAPFSHYKKQALSVVLHPQTVLLLVLTLLTFAMLGGPLITCFPMLADQVFQASPMEIGWIIAWASLSSGAVAASLPFLYRRFTPKIILLAGQFCYGIALLSLPVMPTFLWLGIPVLFYGLGQGLTLPLCTTLLTGQAQIAERAALMGANSFVVRIAQTFAPLIFSYLASLYSPAFAIQSAIILPFSITILVLLFQLPDVISSEKRIAID